MLDVVAPHDDELTLAVETEHVDHAQPRRPSARAARRSQAIGEGEPIDPKREARDDEDRDHARQRRQGAAVSKKGTQR